MAHDPDKPAAPPRSHDAPALASDDDASWSVKVSDLGISPEARELLSASLGLEGDGRDVALAGQLNAQSQRLARTEAAREIPPPPRTEPSTIAPTTMSDRPTAVLPRRPRRRSGRQSLLTIAVAVMAGVIGGAAITVRVMPLMGQRAAAAGGSAPGQSVQTAGGSAVAPSAPVTEQAAPVAAPVVPAAAPVTRPAANDEADAGAQSRRSR